MSDLAQCPKCGEHKLGLEVFRVDSATGHIINSLNCSEALLLFLIITITFGFLATKIHKETILAAGLIAMLLFVMPAVGFLYHIKRDRAEKHSYKLYKYHCRQCDYHWEFREGQSLSRVTIHPQTNAIWGAQRWTCIRCGTLNDGTRGSCSYCSASRWKY